MLPKLVKLCFKSLINTINYMYKINILGITVFYNKIVSSNKYTLKQCPRSIQTGWNTSYRSEYSCKMITV